MLRRISSLACAAILGSLLGATGPAAAAPAPRSEPGKRVIVVLRDVPMQMARRRTADVTTRHAIRASQAFSRVFSGFAAELPESKIRELRADPAVAGVYPDRPTKTANTEIPPGVRRMQAHTVTGSRIGTRTDVDVDIAILDTGINAHPDLNLAGGVNCATHSGCSATAYTDNQGHGTHVAGTAAARDNGTGVVGTAPGARLWAVKTLGDDGSGYMSWFIAGLDWVAARGDIEVVNASLGGYGRPGDVVSQAVDRAVAAGVVVVVAAGNENADAKDSSPANAPAALTVSAYVDSDGAPGGLGVTACGLADDTRATFSNYGGVVDFAAPGVCILSTSRTGSYQYMSGTSMASPHVAGAAATYIALNAVPSSAQRSAVVRYGLRHEWSTSQQSPCGFRNGRSAEVVLVMGGCAGTGDVVGPTPVIVGLTTDTTTVSLSWSAAADPAGVTGYAVYRSTGTPEAYALHATLDPWVRTYTDLDAPAGPAGARHRYYVQATDGLGNTSVSAVAHRDSTPPPAPRPRAVAQDSSVALGWPAVSDPSGIEFYEVWRVAETGPDWALRATLPGTTLRHIDTGALNGLPYHYVIGAVDHAGNAEYSNVLRAVPDANAVPAAPEVTVAPGGGPVTLHWSILTDPAKVTHYEVWRGDGAHGGISRLATVAATASAFVDRTAVSGATYTYEVRSWAGDRGGYSSNAVVVTPRDTVAPTAVTVTPTVSDSRVRLAWTPATDAWGVAGYRVWRATGTGSFVQLTSAPRTVRGYDDYWLRAGTTYRYYVRALDQAGNLGPASAIVTVTTPKTKVRAASVRYASGATRSDGKRALWISTMMVSETGARAAGAKIALELRNTRGTLVARLSPTAGSTGLARTLVYLPKGTCYRVKVVAVSSTGRTWDRLTPRNYGCVAR